MISRDRSRAVNLASGETKAVTFSVSSHRLAFWHEQTSAWIVEPGAFEVMVGRSSADIRLVSQFQVTAAGQWRPGELIAPQR